MPVDSLVRRGYLADIAQLLEGDPDMSADDIVLAGRLGGGTYYLSRGFGIETYAGLKSNFGEEMCIRDRVRTDVGAGDSRRHAVLRPGL